MTHCQKNYWNVLAIFFWSKDLFWAQRQISKINEKDSVWKGDSDKKGNYCGKKKKERWEAGAKGHEWVTDSIDDTGSFKVTLFVM